VLIEHLISLGHSRIAIIVEPESVSTARERRQGYREALQAAGFLPLRELLVETTGDLRGGYSGMLLLLDQHPRPTAVFASNNLVAVGAVKALRENGLEVPSDMALVAFDDIEHVAALCPFLTVMPQPAETIGTVAAQLLLDRLRGPGPDEPRQVVLPSTLVVRESSGAKLAERRA
jgi:LacI family transcriptional regulator